jgi:hypothetical protein
MNLRELYSLQQVEYCRNFTFRRHFPIHKIFERSCEMGLGQTTAFNSAMTSARRGP